MPLPRLRPIEAFVLENGDEPAVGIRDPEGIVPGLLQLSPGAFFIASLLDGVRGLAEVKDVFAEQHQGHILEDDEVEGLVAQLDEGGLLETPTYRLMRAEVRRKFGEMSVRLPSHAGGAYPDQASELKSLIGSLLEGREPSDLDRSDTGLSSLSAEPGERAPGDNAPVVPAPSGLVDAGGAPIASSLAPESATRDDVEAAGPIRGLVAPHIDFLRGGAVYADAYRRLRRAPPPELVVVLGVAHAGPLVPFIVTRKDFETPLGLVETDATAVSELTEACGEWIVEEEYTHRLEHSIEFQLVWLQSVFPQSAMRIVPILCGAFEQFCGRKSPSTDSRIASTIAAIRRLVEKSGALILASVDFAHMGPSFGDTEVEVDEALADGMRKSDARLLDRAKDGACESFWNEGMADLNARHVDALAAVYTLLAVLAPVKGKQLGYGQGEDPAGGLVSFASLSYE